MLEEGWGVITIWLTVGRKALFSQEQRMFPAEKNSSITFTTFSLVAYILSRRWSNPTSLAQSLRQKPAPEVLTRLSFGLSSTSVNGRQQSRSTSPWPTSHGVHRDTCSFWHHAEHSRTLAFWLFSKAIDQPGSERNLGTDGMKLKSHYHYPLPNAGLLFWQISTKLCGPHAGRVDVCVLNVEAWASGLIERWRITEEIALMSCGPSVTIRTTWKIKEVHMPPDKWGSLFSLIDPSVVENKLYEWETILCWKGSLVLEIKMAAKVLFSDIHLWI